MSERQRLCAVPGFAGCCAAGDKGDTIWSQPGSDGQLGCSQPGRGHVPLWDPRRCPGLSSRRCCRGPSGLGTAVPAQAGGEKAAGASCSALSNLPRFPSSLFAVAGFPQLILTAAGWAVTSTCNGKAQNPGVTLDGTLRGDPGMCPLHLSWVHRTLSPSWVTARAAHGLTPRAPQQRVPVPSSLCSWTLAGVALCSPGPGRTCSDPRCLCLLGRGGAAPKPQLWRGRGARCSPSRDPPGPSLVLGHARGSAGSGDGA